MKNKIREVICFICFSILSGILLPVYAESDYQITASLSNFNKYITYTKTPRGVVLSVNSSVFFDKNRDEIKENSKEFLDQIGEFIKLTDKPGVIEGNAKISDNNYDTNWEISITRAQKIAQYLIEVHQLSPQKIRAIGFGSIMPETLTQRIDFVIIDYENGAGS